jgi:hypothetical protein
MAVTTKGILSPRSADLKDLDTTNICSYNLLVKMGVGGMSAATNRRLEDVATAMDEYLRRAEEDIGERLSTLNRVRRARRQLELLMWRTSPVFCKAR